MNEQAYLESFVLLALPRLEPLMAADPDPTTPAGRELLLLAALVEEYEQRLYPEFARGRQLVRECMATIDNALARALLQKAQQP